MTASTDPGPGSSDPTRSATDEVDHTLLDWYGGLSLVERLRAASRAAATLDRLAHAASTDR